MSNGQIGVIWKRGVNDIVIKKIMKIQFNNQSFNQVIVRIQKSLLKLRIFKLYLKHNNQCKR